MLAGYNYSGVHKLPDGRLMACMHQHWGPTPDFETPCVAFSTNDGMTWSEPEFVTTPGTFCGPVIGPRAESAPRNEEGIKDNSRQRCPVALVTRAGRIVILFARRTADRGCRGIIGVVSDDLGKTWSEEFVVRGDATAGISGIRWSPSLPTAGCSPPIGGRRRKETCRFPSLSWCASSPGPPFGWTSSIRYNKGTESE